jgi:membrane-bound lytic murein transglycosylase MltF
MRKIRLYHFFLVVLACHFACDNATQKTNSAKDGNAGADTSESLNLRGDSITYIPGSPDNEILGLANTAFGDLDSMIARRYIRVLVPYSRTFYYVEGLKTHGLAHDLLNLFEKELNDQLHFNPAKVRIIFLPVSREHITQLLMEGHADMIAAGFAITPDREKLVDFSLPTVTGVRDIVVGGPSAPPIKSVRDLSGKKIYVRQNSVYEVSLTKLNDSLKKAGLQPVQIEFTGPFIEAEDVLEMVNADILPYTVISEDLATLWNSVYTNLKVYTNIPVAGSYSFAWAFRKNSPKLKVAVNKFIPKIMKGSEVGNILYDKYLKNKTRLTNTQSKQALADLNNFRKLFIRYGDTYSLDWLLLTAQAFQESQLKQETVSHAGAVGVMQVLPKTAAAAPINISNVRNAENNIHAGVKYMRYLIDHYVQGNHIDSLNRHLLALAAYNCGPGNMAKLRREAKANGLDENLWFNNVEIMAARHIGRETVQYVSNIYRYYWSYQALQNFKDVRDHTSTK